MRREWIPGAVGAGVFDALARGMGGSELQSVLLEVLRERARGRSPREVLEQYRRDRFVRPAAVDQRASVEVDRQLLAAAEGFEAVELSPLAPLGTCSVLALTDQHRVVSALRGTEVVSDPTNVFALECAERLRATPDGEWHLATSQRVVRAQPAPRRPGFAQHFRIFVLASAGRERAEHGFAVAALVRHVATFQRALDRLEEQGYAFGTRRVDLLATDAAAPIADRVAASIPGAVRGPLEHAYYSGGVRYMLWITAPDGTEIPLGDGGVFDWLPQLTGNRRHVYVASGLGAQLISQVLRSP